jgi:hypothetical protein
VLRRLRSGLCFFPVFIHIKSTLSIQAQAAKLHRCPVDCMFAGHHYCFLLFLKAALEAC